MSNGADRRPWLILSRREGQALLQGMSLLHALGELNPDMRTAREQLMKQLAWINGHDGEEPTKEAAVQREHDARAEAWAMSNAAAEERAL